MGIYKLKSVQYIVENIIDADWEDSSGLHVIKSTSEVTNEQKGRLAASIKEPIAEGWDLAKGHRFFLFKDFIKTDFKKITSGGIFRVRYFNLEDYFLPTVPDSIEELAEQLKAKTWE